MKNIRPQINFRLDEENLALMEHLFEALGTNNKTKVMKKSLEQFAIYILGQEKVNQVKLQSLRKGE